MRLNKQKKGEGGFIKGAIWIAGGGFLAKVIGALYRIPLTNLIGGKGLGLYQLVYPIYCLLLTVSATGIPSSIAKLTAERVAKGEALAATYADADAQEAQLAIDVLEKELERIAKELEKARKNLASLEGKLSNENFVSRAPEHVVADIREKAQKARDLIAGLVQSEEAMKKL